jgi:hypothetical protein
VHRKPIDRRGFESRSERSSQARYRPDEADSRNEIIGV